MKVYFSGIGGTGIGPLAELAQDAEFEVFGSDLKEGAISEELRERHIEVAYGEQDGSFLQKMIDERGVDWSAKDSRIAMWCRKSWRVFRASAIRLFKSSNSIT